jgi:hypothetical protein
MRVFALALGDLGYLAVGAQRLENACQVQDLGRAFHLLGEPELELGAFAVNERVADAARGPDDTNAGIGFPSPGVTGKLMAAPYARNDRLG